MPLLCKDAVLLKILPISVMTEYFIRQPEIFGRVWVILWVQSFPEYNDEWTFILNVHD